jgi:hypothetical protein
MTARVTLRRKRLERAMKTSGIKTNRDLATALKMDTTTAWRLRTGRTGPGRESTAAILKAFPELTYEDLFECLDDKAVA